MKPAVVRFIGDEHRYLTEDMYYIFNKNKCYDAYFLEYWQGTRKSLHVKGNDGEIRDFIPYEDFQLVKDEYNVLNLYEADVKCITDEYDNKLFDLNKGGIYKAIGHDKQGNYLVMDESCDCYFYPKDEFLVINDEHGVLSDKRYIVYDSSIWK